MFAAQTNTKPIYIMFSGKCKKHVLILLCLFLTITACNNTSKRPVDSKVSHCDTFILAGYRQQKGETAEPLARGRFIRTFYNNVPAACHNNIAVPIIDDMFDLVYGTPSTDSLVLPFLKKLSDE